MTLARAAVQNGAAYEQLAAFFRDGNENRGGQFRRYDVRLAQDQPEQVAVRCCFARMYLCVSFAVAIMTFRPFCASLIADANRVTNPTNTAIL